MNEPIDSEELLKQLSDLRESKEGLARMINEAKAGKSSTTMSSLMRIEDKLLLDELNIQTNLAKLSKKQKMEDSAELSTSTATQQELEGDTRTKGPRQATLGRFFDVRSRDGHVHKLNVPDFIDDNPDLMCKACQRHFKSKEGLIEHQNHCAKLALEKMSASSLATLKEIKQDHAAVLLSHPRSLIVHDEEEEEAGNQEEEDRDSVDSDATADRTSSIKVENRKGERFRNRYTKRVKYRIALLVEALKKEGVEAAESKVVELTGMPATNVHNWYRSLKELERELFLMRGKKGRGHAALLRWNSAKRSGKGAAFAAAEEVVFGKYESARLKGIRVGPMLLKSWMKRAVRELYTSIKAGAFRTSSGWLQRFLARFDLKSRRATNCKEQSVGERLPKVQRWHKRWQYFVSHGGSNHSLFGRYLPQNILNADQVPVRASEMSNVTYEKRGAQTVRIAQQKGSDKRMATLQVCISLDGSADQPKPQPRIAIIFRGKGNITATERAAYDPRVDVYFQPKAWMDGKLFVEWTNRTLRPFVHQLPAGPKVMVMDNLRAQVSEESGDALREIGVDRRLLPEGTTDMIQPVDQNVGVHIKRILGELLNQRLTDDSAFQERWLGVDGTFTAKERRILMTQILGEAYEKFCASKDFFDLGMSTGCVMTRLGVDRTVGVAADHPIRIKGIPVYQFEHVPLGDPTPVLVEEDPDVLEGKDDGIDLSTPLPPPVVNPAISSDELGDIHLYGIDEIGKNSSKENEEIVEDDDEADALQDDSDIQTAVAPPNCPEGYCFDERPHVLPSLSSWIKRELLWRAELPNGEELAWIKTIVVGGPADPQQALQGITMRLKCDHRQDPNTPTCFRGKFSCIVQVALTPENYGQKWFLLKKNG